MTRIEDLESLDLIALRDRWRALYGAAPLLRSPALLRRIIAWRLQAQQSPDLARALDQAMGHGWQQASSSTHPTGALLSRTWRGVRHQVWVVAGGYAWNGQVYPTLSQIAALITDGRREGASFFGDPLAGTDL